MNLRSSVFIGGLIFFPNYPDYDHTMWIVGVLIPSMIALDVLVWWWGDRIMRKSAREHRGGSTWNSCPAVRVAPGLIGPVLPAVS